MTYFSQSINAPAEGATFAMRLKFYCILFISVMLLLPVPWLVAVISLTMLWHGLIGWTYKTSPAQWIGRKVNASAQWLGAIMLKDVRNSPYLISLFGVGILTPALFIFSFWWQSQQTHFNWWAVLAYHVITYGPYFAFFSQVATLIHKEGHEPKGFFKPRFAFLNKFFGRFMVFFYGHVPEGYPMGHMRIHHKHDNGPDDVTSTVFYNRTQAIRFMIYLFEFMLFWTGISIAYHFYQRNRMDECRRMITGMVVYYLFIGIVMYFNFWFAFGYILLPHLSTIIFLAAINYTWHAWTDPNDLKNIYKNSITVLEGQYNVYNEDFHVEHHKRPQTHWEEYPVNYQKHLNEYAANRAIVFQDTQAFEIFFWLLFGSYDKMADHMVDLNNDMSQEDKIKLLKHRLQPIS